MKITAKDLHHLNVIDSVIDEPLGGAHNNIEQQAIDIKQAFVDQLEQLQQQSADELVEDRFNKFRNIGAFIEKQLECDTYKLIFKTTLKTQLQIKL